MCAAFSLSPALQLPVVSRLSPRVVRVMGLNPSPMTLGGTNTYLVGKGPNRLLIDTGEGCAGYTAALQQALAESAAELGAPVRIAQVLFTHWHHDHIGGWRQVQQLFPQAQGLKAPTRVLKAGGGVEGETQPVKDGDTIALDDGETTLTILGTPGHTDDHLCVLLKEEEAIFTGDCVLGAGSSIFASYTDFMASLERLKQLRPRILYPGHGPVAADAGAYLDAYIGHRLKRETQILQALASPEVAAAGGLASIDDLVTNIYAATTPPELLGGAALNVSHQLKKLLREGRVVARDAGAVDTSAPALTTADIVGADDDYWASAGSGMITAALKALTDTPIAADRTADSSCAACDAAATAGAQALMKLKTLRWSLVPAADAQQSNSIGSRL